MQRYEREMSFSERILKTTESASDLNSVLSAVSEALDSLRYETGNTRTGLVSGKIRARSDYLELINRRRIQSETERIRKITRGITVINFGDIFGERNDLYTRVTKDMGPEERGEALCGFCVDLVEREVTDLFLLPGWEDSVGACLEREVVLRKKGVIYQADGINDLVLYA